MERTVAAGQAERAFGQLLPDAEGSDIESEEEATTRYGMESAGAADVGAFDFGDVGVAGNDALNMLPGAHGLFTGGGGQHLEVGALAVLEEEGGGAEHAHFHGGLVVLHQRLNDGRVGGVLAQTIHVEAGFLSEALS